jgi:hypothetical protein
MQGLDWSGWEWGQVADAFECGNEPSGSQKCGVFLEKQRNLAFQEGLCCVELYVNKVVTNVLSILRHLQLWLHWRQDCRTVNHMKWHSTCCRISTKLPRPLANATAVRLSAESVDLSLTCSLCNVLDLKAKWNEHWKTTVYSAQFGGGGPYGEKWYDMMIRYDIFVNCNWVATRWQ